MKTTNFKGGGVFDKLQGHFFLIQMNYLMPAIK